MNEFIQTGLLINLRQWKMTDEQTGELMSGTTIHLAVEMDQQAQFKGFEIMKLGSRDISLFTTIDPSLAGKQVEVKCIVKAGKKITLVPQSVKLLQK